MSDVLLIHYSEIGTKGHNRSFFERHLRASIREGLAPAQTSDVRLEHGRFVAPLVPGYSEAAVRGVMDNIFGVAWYAFARTVSWDWKEIESTALECARAEEGAKTFKVFCRRSDKTFPMMSEAVCRKLGQVVGDTLGLKVNLERHDLALHVEILPGRALVYSNRVQGVRGLPRGTSGRMLCLFSGGIDSPVAAWRMMRRGAAVDLVHFHPFRRAADVADSKIMGLYKALRAWSPGLRMYLIPHYHYQVKAALEIPGPYEMVLFRRFIFKAAQALAWKWRAKALITGDSLGQVASQTVENLAAAQTELSIPIFLPLIAMDKEEIIREAQHIGTYELSIRDYKDCCSLMSRHPKTMARLELVRAMEAKLGFDELIRASLEDAELWDGESLRPLRPKREAPVGSA